MPERIGAVVITHNESPRIEACLRSLSFCDERVVVDSFSTDDTVERARPLAEHIYRRDFLHHADQKNWGIEQLDTPWVVVLDADERIPEDLAVELRELVERGEFDGWWIHRRNRFFGRFIEGAGWSRDRVLRLFRRARGRYGQRFLHEEVEMDEGARVATCRHRIEHDSYADWNSTFARLRSYSTAGARERARRGHRGSAVSVVARPTGRFLRQYFMQAGWRDGLHGLVLCHWSASGVFLREAKLLLGEGTGPDSGLPGSSSAQRVERVQGREPTEANRPPRGSGSGEGQL